MWGFMVGKKKFFMWGKRADSNDQSVSSATPSSTSSSLGFDHAIEQIALPINVVLIGLSGSGKKTLLDAMIPTGSHLLKVQKEPQV